MGVKPLFYYPTADGVLFGSEPKAILAHPTVQPRVNKDGLREILVLAKNPELTIYAGMCEVRPGQVVRVSRNGLTKRRYWMLTAREHEDDLPRTESHRVARRHRPTVGPAARRCVASARRRIRCTG
jgi:asparagine synthase (glutamine-hydrolysing)